MKLCGINLEIGDFVKVRYTTGHQFKNGTIKGKIIELVESHKQGQVESGWCFHDYDEILIHEPKQEAI